MSHRLSPAAAVLPGLGVALVLGLAAFCVAPTLPLIGAPVLGVLLGVGVAVLGPHLPAFGALTPGLRFASSRVLQLAVVLLGAQLSLGQIAESGVDALPVLAAVIVACLLGAWWAGRALGVDRDLRMLLGVGTAICGASAIAAITPVLRAGGEKVAYALSVVFACNIAAVLVFPVLGQVAGLDPQAFGIFVGAAVNDTSSVLAAAASFGPQATDTAVVVKLTRTLAIIPIVLGLSVLVSRWRRTGADDDAPARARMWQLVPWFLIGFLVLAAVNSLGLVPAVAHDPLAVLATFCITVALCAVGASTDLPGLRRAGARPMVLGVGLWLGVTAVALGTQAVTGLLTFG